MLDKIFVDADSCNSRVIRFLQSFVFKRSIGLILVSNKSLNLKGAKNVDFRVVGDVDSCILGLVDKNSIVITRDVLLAKHLLDLEIRVINDEGCIFNTNNINYLHFRSNMNNNLGFIRVKKYLSYETSKARYSNFTMNFHRLFFS
ncbi:DUF188 domain-containing protein [Borrelia sp. RT5S]|uniref:DUF188 domain-containing protein n=1 Tax=Borrelia sp. RT5S TaxID=2898581 RepID=UPI001E4C58D6|nr:DUF188 domain-containing protein [Borrelia sp. RT5S]UGQ15750.1 DUF188 domain-containing protein [Borrelia sp. RT5S]